MLEQLVQVLAADAEHLGCFALVATAPFQHRVGCGLVDLGHGRGEGERGLGLGVVDRAADEQVVGVQTAVSEEYGALDGVA